MTKEDYITLKYTYQDLIGSCNRKLEICDAYTNRNIAKVNIFLLKLDLETTPNIFKVKSWNVGDEVILRHDDLIQERQVIMCSYNWLSDKEDDVKRITWGNRQDDTRIIKKMTKIMAEADIVIGHNGDRFDIKWLKTRALILGLEPIHNVVSIDTLKLTRSNFRLNSNKLDYITQVLGLPKKISTSYDLWTRVMNGDKEALEEMGVYCDNDVTILRQTFLRILPYVAKLPVNLGLMLHGIDSPNILCRHCAKPQQMVRRGFAYTLRGKYQIFVCKNCHHSQRSNTKED